MSRKGVQCRPQRGIVFFETLKHFDAAKEAKAQGPGLRVMKQQFMSPSRIRLFWAPTLVTRAGMGLGDHRRFQNLRRRSRDIGYGTRSHQTVRES